MKAKVKTWLLNVANGTIRNHTEKTLECICGYERISTLELRNYLGTAHQTLTSCLTVLNDEGLIKVVGQIKVDNSYYSVYSFVSDLEERDYIVTRRRIEKYIQWLKKAESYKDLMKLETYRDIRGECVQFTFPNV